MGNSQTLKTQVINFNMVALTPPRQLCSQMPWAYFYYFFQK
jgi:hypothetical protein